MDWILVSNLVENITSFVEVIAIIYLVIFLFGGFIAIIADDLDEEAPKVKKWMKINLNMLTKGILITVIFAVTNTVTNIPKIMIKSNIDRVKIYYTSEQSIKKIESGALEVVNKLDALIDKGIETMGSGLKQKEIK